MVEVLERKGLCTKQEPYDTIEEPRTRNSASLQGKVLVPDADNTSRIEQALIDRVDDLIQAVGFKPAQAKELLRRASVLFDGQRDQATTRGL